MANSLSRIAAHLSSHIASILLALIFSLGGFACESGTDPTTDINLICQQAAEVAGWERVGFKNNYTIQIPEGYVGYGMVGFEGNIFDKYRSDSSVQLNYAYCGPLYCNDFGRSLNSPLPDTVMVEVDNQQQVVAKRTIRICNKDSTAGYLYLSEGSPVEGLYFMNVEGEYKQALGVRFREDRRDEVISILKSIAAR